jgi:hypothetical protein
MQTPPKKLVAYVDPGFDRPVAEAARGNYLSKSDYVRLALTEKLQREGSYKPRDKAA